jgi:hypothetical protein
MQGWKLEDTGLEHECEVRKLGFHPKERGKMVSRVQV